jgi:hypothetical protein
MKFIPRREGKRKAVTASRATESGQPDSWDAPMKHDPSIYENYMANADAERKSKRAAAEERAKPGTATVEKAPRADDSRMRYLGDD